MELTLWITISTVIPRVAPNWFQIGLKLKMKPFTLGTIKETDRTTAQCLAMLNDWLNRGSRVDESIRPTWENFHKAMTELELTAGAERLKDKLVQEDT